jgi:hypothetical protein
MGLSMGGPCDHHDAADHWSRAPSAQPPVRRADGAARRTAPGQLALATGIVAVPVLQSSELPSLKMISRS